MFNRFLKIFESWPGSRARACRAVDLSALAHLDRDTLEDIGVSPQRVALSSPGEAVRWSAGVIASGHSARWSLSGDWERAR